MSELHGSRAGAVVDLLKRRRSGTDSGTARKLALIVEGGGMRGVLSAGSLLAVDLLGFRHAFDEVYATSAGAVNAAYFLSGQGTVGISVYFDCINNRRFINPARLTKIVDVDFVYDRVVPLLKPLDEQAIRNARPRLFFSVSDALTGSNELLDVQRIAAPIPLMLKASCALPVLYNRTVSIAGRRYVDGGVTSDLPVSQAISRGCTDILVLLTRPADHVKMPPGLLHRAVFYLLMGWRYPALYRSFQYGHLEGRRNRAMAFGCDVPDHVNIATICPTHEEMVVGRTTLDRRQLLLGAYRLAVATAKIFNDPDDVIVRVFADFGHRTQNALLT